MRKSVKALSVILILVLAVNLTACNADAKTMVGTWKETGPDNFFNATLTLNKDGTFTEIDNVSFLGSSEPFTYTGTYKLDTKEKTITLYPEPSDGNVWFYYYTLGTEHMTWENKGLFADVRNFEKQS